MSMVYPPSIDINILENMIECFYRLPFNCKIVQLNVNAVCRLPN